MQALRAVVQAQQAQLKTLQELQQSQPLIGFTTDQPWGLVLEGLLMGLAALAVGVGGMVAWRALSRAKQAPVAAAAPQTATPPEFSDSMLYLADQEGAHEAAPVATPLHTPKKDTEAQTGVQGDMTSTLPTPRMAWSLMEDESPENNGLAAQDAAAANAKQGGASKPAQSPNGFDERAAAEDVERVRRHLAQRRADRAKRSAAPASETTGQQAASAVSAMAAEPIVEQSTGAEVDIYLELDMLPELDLGANAASPDPEITIRWEDLLPSMSSPEPAPASAQPAAVPTLPPMDPFDSMEHVALSEGASLLASLSEAVPETPPQAQPQMAFVAAPGAFPDEEATATAALNLDDSMLEWELVPLDSKAGAEPTAVTDAALPAEAEPTLDSAHVQLELAQEFRDLGLWEEAKARVLEILEQPDAGLHAQARAMLEELAQTAPGPLDQLPDIDPVDFNPTL